MVKFYLNEKFVEGIGMMLWCKDMYVRIDDGVRGEREGMNAVKRIGDTVYMGDGRFVSDVKIVGYK